MEYEEKKNTMEINGCHQLSGYLHSSKYIILFDGRKKLIQVWNNMRLRMNKWWQNLDFCVKYPFNEGFPNTSLITFLDLSTWFW